MSPRPRAVDAQTDFAGGLNRAATDAGLEPNELRLARNARLTVFGAVQKRKGTQRTSASPLGAGSTEIRGGAAWFQPTSTTDMAVRNGVLYTTTSNTIPITWTTEVGSLSTTAYPSFAAFRDGTGECMYIADGGKLNKYKAGSLTVDIAATPSAIKRIAVQNQRLFGISGVDQTLYWSALNNGDTLGDVTNSDAGSQVVRTFGNQEITALLALGQSLLMFHKTGISRFTGYGNDDITIASGTRGVAADVGTLAPDSIVAVENTAFFLSDRGFYEVNEGGIKPIGQKIDNIMSDWTSANIYRCKAVHSRANREVWWFVPDLGIYVYNYRLQAWTGQWGDIYATPDVHALWESVDSVGRPIVFSGHATDGYVRKTDIGYKDDVLSDGTGGSAFTLSAQCHRMYCDAPENEKAFRFIEVEGDFGSSANAGVSWTTEVGSGSVTFPTQASGSISQRAQAGGRGKYIDVTITDSSTNATPTISRVRVDGFLYASRY